MKKTAIIINGKGGVGKDTLCDFISKHYNTRKVSSITQVDGMAAKMINQESCYPI